MSAKRPEMMIQYLIFAVIALASSYAPAAYAGPTLEEQKRFVALVESESASWYGINRIGRDVGFTPRLMSKDAQYPHDGSPTLSLSAQGVVDRIKAHGGWKAFVGYLADMGLVVHWEPRPIEAGAEGRGMQPDESGASDVAAASNKGVRVDGGKLSVTTYQEKRLRLRDYIGDIPSKVHELSDYVRSPHVRQLYAAHKLAVPKGFVFHGPPGTGKTYLARCIAGELGVPCHLINSPELLSHWGNETEEKIVQAFRTVRQLARKHPLRTAILCLDEFDTIGACRGGDDSGWQMARNSVVNTLLTCMDGFAQQDDSQVVVIGCTNRMDKLDPALIRAGRLENHILIAPPHQEGRQKLLMHYMKEHSLPVHESREPLVAKIAQQLDDSNAADVKLHVQGALRTIIQHRMRDASQRPIDDKEVLTMITNTLHTSASQPHAAAARATKL